MKKGIEPPYKHLTPFKRCVLQNFPFIEADFDALTNYGLLCKIVEYLNDVIASQNEVQGNVEALNNAFIELKNFVDNYFENLDVQDEINNKLDAMVESGQFQELVGEYLVYKMDYYEVTDETEDKLQELLNSERQLYIRFMNDYTFTSTKRMKGNKIIDLNNHTITFDIPTVTDDYTASHGFYNFERTDEFTDYNGNGDITFKNGTMEGGNLSFCHAKGINVINVHFLNCKNNHILEMCAISDLKVEGCIFEGIPATSTGECIQNDIATYSSFPWLPSTSPTYDNTPCRNFTINNCVFKNSSDLNYALNAAIGTHGTVEGTVTSNFTITNCYIENPTGYSIQLYDMDNLVIKNCTFVATASQESFSHIFLRDGVKNSVIAENSFTAGTRGITCATPYGNTENLLIENNKFLNYTSVEYYNYSIINLVEPINTRIKGNIFENYSQYCIILNKTTNYDDTIDYVTYVENNLFKPKNVINGSVNLNCGTGYVTGNTFDCTGYNPNNEVIYGRNTAIGLFADNNTFSANIKEKKKDVKDNTATAYSEVYGVTKRIWSGDEASVTIDPTESYDVTKFNRIGLTVGPTTRVQPITLRPYQKEDKLRAMTWAFPVILSDNTISYATLQLDDTGKLIFSSTAHLKIVYLFNEH